LAKPTVEKYIDDIRYNFGLTSIVSVKVVNTSNHGFTHPPYSPAELGENKPASPNAMNLQWRMNGSNTTIGL